METPKNGILVITEKPQESIVIDELYPVHAVGIVDRSGAKGFFRDIVKSQNTIQILSADGSKIYSDGGNNHREALERSKKCVASSQIIHVIKFDTWSDLYLWLAE